MLNEKRTLEPSLEGGGIWYYIDLLLAFDHGCYLRRVVLYGFPYVLQCWHDVGRLLNESRHHGHRPDFSVQGYSTVSDKFEEILEGPQGLFIYGGFLHDIIGGGMEVQGRN